MKPQELVSEMLKHMLWVCFQKQYDVFANNNHFLNSLSSLSINKGRYLFIYDITHNGGVHGDNKLKYYIEKVFYSLVYPHDVRRQISWLSLNLYQIIDCLSPSSIRIILAIGSYIEDFDTFGVKF